MTTRSAARLAERTRRASARSWWADGLIAAIWITAAIGVSLNIASGGLLVGNGADAVRASGRLVGIVAAVLMMSQVLLASRAPWIERVMGHDRAIARHAMLGKYALLLMLAHAGLIVTATASDGRVSVVYAYLHIGEGNLPLTSAAIAIAMFALVLLTSLFAVFRNWHYESWHTVHRIVYVAIALAVPHQFTEGQTYRAGGFAWFFWFACYVVAFGSFVIYRMLRPARPCREAPRTRRLGDARGRRLLDRRGPRQGARRAGRPPRPVPALEVLLAAAVLAEAPLLALRRSARRRAAHHGQALREGLAGGGKPRPRDVGHLRGPAGGVHPRGQDALRAGPRRRGHRDHADPRLARARRGRGAVRRRRARAVARARPRSWARCARSPATRGRRFGS